MCIILDQQPDGLHMLMIQRAEHPNDPWSGQMGFPGGKQDLNDANITITALREASEELSISADAIKRVGRLSDILARPYRAFKPAMTVTPIIFAANDQLSPSANHEVQDWLWLPLDFFQDQQNRQAMQIEKAGLSHELPFYEFANKRVWGLSLMMIDELCHLLASE